MKEKTSKILENIISNQDNHVLLVGENHIHHAPKDFLISNIDILKNNSRKIVVLLEHISADKRDDENIQDLYNQKENLDKRIWDNFSTQYSFLEGGGQKFPFLAKKLIENEVEIHGAENKTTNFTSASTSLGLRVILGNTSFTQEITEYVKKGYFVILLSGYLHLSDTQDFGSTPGVQSMLKQNGIKSISWVFEDCEHVDQEGTFFDITMKCGSYSLAFDIKTTYMPHISDDFIDFCDANKKELNEIKVNNESRFSFFNTAINLNETEDFSDENVNRFSDW